MPVDSPINLVQTLGRISLLSPEQQNSLTRELLPGCGDTQALARRLLQRGWVTPYQINRLLLGRASELIVGPYVLLERLGEGGAGEVFKARHQHMSRISALKLIRKDALADKETVGRFQREVHVLAQLEHPNVIHAYDAGPVGDNFFLAMEYVEGVDLQRLVHEKGPLPIEAACNYICQAAAGLQYIHERGMVHRDIKPSNLVVTRNEAHSNSALVKILDLGLARLQRPIDSSLTGGLTATGAVAIGTLDFMAPEQALDFHTADIRSDIYSLGCTFYFLLAGRAPFAGGTAAQILLNHQQKEPPPLEPIRSDLPAGVSRTLRRMIAKSPGARFQTPGEVKEALEAGGNGSLTGRISGSITDVIEAVRIRPETSRSRRRLLLAAGVLAILLMAFFVVKRAFLSPRPPSSSPQQAVVASRTTATSQAPVPRAFLLHVDKGQLTNDSAGSTRLQTVDFRELGAKAMKVDFAPSDFVGVSAAAVANWKPFGLLRMDFFNPSKEPVLLLFTIRHARSTTYQTRIDLPISLKPGKNEIEFAVDKLANVNGTPPDLGNVVRWYFANTEKKAATVYFGNIWLEGSSPKTKSP